MVTGWTLAADGRQPTSLGGVRRCNTLSAKPYQTAHLSWCQEVHHSVSQTPGVRGRAEELTVFKHQFVAYESWRKNLISTLQIVCSNCSSFGWKQHIYIIRGSRKAHIYMSRGTRSSIYMTWVSRKSHIYLSLGSRKRRRYKRDAKIEYINVTQLI